MSRYDLLTVGEAFEDLIFADLPRLPCLGEEIKTSSFERSIGGGAVITVVAAARLGLRCRILSGLSSEAVKRLGQEKVAVRNLRRAGEKPAISAALSTTSDRSFVTYNGINDFLEDRLEAPVRRAQARHVHFAFYPRDCARWTSVISSLRRRHITSSWDFGWNDGLIQDAAFLTLASDLDYFFMNEKEARLYSGSGKLDVAMGFWREHTRNAIIKQGAEGAHWVSASFVLHSAAIQVDVLDTTGAGDAFNGDFLWALLRGKSSQECLALGNRTGGLSTMKAGGIEALPRNGELE